MICKTISRQPCNQSLTRGRRQDVIASAAKQSPSRQAWRLLRRFTPRNDMIDENICPVKLNDYAAAILWWEVVLDNSRKTRYKTAKYTKVS